MPNLAEHRLFTAAPVECDCHADRAPAVPRFAAEALPSRSRRRRRRRRPAGNGSSPDNPAVPDAAKILNRLPPVPPDVDAFTWLAVVNAAVAALNTAAKNLERAKHRRRTRRRPDRHSDKLRRLCGVCAAEIHGRGFSLREAWLVYDLAGKMRMQTMNRRHAQAVAQAKADSEAQDMVLLSVPVFVGTRQEATREELVRPGRR